LRKYFGVLACLALLVGSFVFPNAILATGAGSWNVDVGNPASESLVTISGWGPIEPATSGGGYGGINDCRCVWEPSAPGVQGEPEACASITYVYEECVQPTQVDLSALDGQATDDGYEVYVDGVLVFTYPDTQCPETWIPQSIDLTQFTLPNSQAHVVEICATGVAWQSFATYGQVAIDYVTLTTIPCEGGNGDVDLNTEVVVGDCICLSVSPYSLNFGQVQQGDVSGTLEITLTNCGDVDIEVTANANGSFYEDCLELSTSPWESAEGWVSPVILEGDSLTVYARVNVPAGYSTGSYSGSLSFVAMSAE